MSQIELKAGIYDKLTAVQTSGTLYDDITGRIFEGQARHDETLPLLIYNVILDDPATTFSKNHIDATVQFDLYYPASSGAAAAAVTNDKIYALLHTSNQGTAWATTGHATAHGICTERGQLTFEEDAIRIRSEFQILATEQ